MSVLRGRRGAICNSTRIGILWGSAAPAILSTGDYRVAHAPVAAGLTAKQASQTSGLSACDVAPCHPWHRDISPSMDKPRGLLNSFAV